MVINLIKYRHLIGYGLAIVALIVLLWYIHHEGYKACERDAMAEELTHQVDATKDRRRDESEVQGFERGNVIDELRSRGELRRD